MRLLLRWVLLAGALLLVAEVYGGVSVASFQRQISVQSVTGGGIREIGPCAVTLARAEGLEAHARAVAFRLEQQREEVVA